MAEVIVTTRNREYKYIKALKQKKFRSAEGVFTVEGIKSVSDAIKAGTELACIVVSESFYNAKEFIYPDNVHIAVVKDGIFAALCDTKTPQGIIAVIKMRKNTQYTCDLTKLYVYCDNVSDPGNLGTIIRTADAAGFGGVLLSPGCADLYSPKTVRSSMGSFFNIDIVPDFDIDMLKAQQSRGFSLFCGALDEDSIIYTDADFTKPSIIIVGNEANGVCKGISEISEHIIIPIYGGAESLNAAVAGAIMMYEAVRRRAEGGEADG